MLSQYHQNSEKFPFKSSHFESGNFRNLSEDDMIASINWCFEKELKDHVFPSAGLFFAFLLKICVDSFNKFCGTLLERENFLGQFSQIDKAKAKNWSAFVSMVSKLSCFLFSFFRLIKGNLMLSLLLQLLQLNWKI